MACQIIVEKRKRLSRALFEVIDDGDMFGGDVDIHEAVFVSEAELHLVVMAYGELEREDAELAARGLSMILSLTVHLVVFGYSYSVDATNGKLD